MKTLLILFLILFLMFMSMSAFASDAMDKQKALPPEIVDGILTFVGVLLGWFARWLKGDVKAQVAEKKVKALESYINSKQRTQ